MTRKKISMLVSVVILVALIVAGGTLAYLSDSATATNVVTLGNIHIDLIEDYEQGQTAMPSQTVKKVVSIKNTGDNPAYVRIFLKKEWHDPKGNLIMGNDGKPLGENMILINFEMDGSWTEGSDGAYYYNASLAPGVETPPLFKTFTISPEVGNFYSGLNGNIIVTAQAVQAANFEQQLVRENGKIISWGEIAIAEPKA